MTRRKYSWIDTDTLLGCLAGGFERDASSVGVLAESGGRCSAGSSRSTYLVLHRHAAAVAQMKFDCS